MDRDPRPLLDARWVIHSVLTAILVWFAACMTWQPQDLLTTSTAFAMLVREAPESVWASGLWGAACIGIVGMVSPPPLVRLVSVGVLSTAHGALAILLLRAGASMLPGVLVIVAMQGYYLVWRCARAGI